MYVHKDVQKKKKTQKSTVIEEKRKLFCTKGLYIEEFNIYLTLNYLE